jgi:hypothetical protein
MTARKLGVDAEKGLDVEGEAMVRDNHAKI